MDSIQGDTGDDAANPILVSSADSAPRNPFQPLPKPGASWAQRAAGTARNNTPRKLPQPAKPAAGPKAPTPIAPLTAGQLNSRDTPLVAIRANAAALGLFLPATSKKGTLIQAYQTALNNSTSFRIPTPPSLNPTAATAPRSRALPWSCTTITTTWSVCRKSGNAHLPFTRPLGGDAPALVQYYQDAIATANPHSLNPLSLLRGHWSTNITNNFVLIFTGSLAIDQVRKYQQIFLRPFDNTFDVVPSKGFTRMIVLGAPCIRTPDGDLPSSTALLQELCTNMPF